MSTATTKTTTSTEVGNYFISNYPPYSAWKTEYVNQARAALDAPPRPGTPLGLYIHIPFCRKRCKFCYFRVFTDKNAADVEQYVAAVVAEMEMYSRRAAVSERPLEFVYFGGGTPSFLSATQLSSLVERLSGHVSWDDAREVTFECEPGTLKKQKLETIKALGVTRLSLGVENFDDRVLEANGRAHLAREIFRSYDWAREVGFDQINIDLIAGMAGETEANWRDCVAKTIELAPESVTIYQMELPYNTVFTREIQGGDRASPVADWATKRAWVGHAFETLEAAGYSVSSAYTLVRDAARTRFTYRDSLWHGADMVGVGVASFSHVGGVHYQNEDSWQGYLSRVESGDLPINRALTLTARQLLIRELILQMKLGRVDVAALSAKHGTDVAAEFAEPLRRLGDAGSLHADGRTVTLTREGLLRADSLLPEFFEPDYRNRRYT